MIRAPESDSVTILKFDIPASELFTWYAQLLKSGVFAAKEAEKEEEKGAKGEKKAGKVTKAKADPAAKKANAPKSGAGTKAKSAGTTLRKSSQRGS